MWQSVDQLISRAARCSGMGKTLQAANVVAVAEAFYHQLLGEQTGQWRVISFQEGRLTINCLNSVIANEISRYESQCRCYLREKISGVELLTIRTRLTDQLETW